MQRQVLGKGLGALLPDAQGGESQLTEIDIDNIKANSLQPRINFEAESIASLAQSIAENGILQPVIVRPSASGGGYELVAGERRWRAAQQANLKSVPALVHKLSDEKMLELALVENIQRDELNVIEEAHAYHLLIEDFGLSQSDVAKRVGRSRSAVANTVRLLSLSASVQAMVLDGSLSMGHSRALLPLPDKEQQRLSRIIAKKQPSVRQGEMMGKQLMGGQSSKEVAPAPTDPNLAAAQRRLEEALHTKVDIVQAKNRGGRLVLHFHNDEELEHLFEILTFRA